MKNFFIKLDKNFVNLIFMFIFTFIDALVSRKYNISFFDKLISIFCIGFYLNIWDKICLSFKKGE